MDAGLKLYGKNPNIAPLSAQVKKAASYLVSIFINAIINKVIHDIKATPAAKPSNPSIKLIAFVMPTTHTIVSGIDKTPTLSQGLTRSEEHTSELQSRQYLVCRLLLEKKKK